jgi:integrase/recombinase XerD
MSELSVSLDEYLGLRRSLGYKLERAGQVLADFVTFVDAADTSYVSIDAAVGWAIGTVNPDSSWRAQRLGYVRGFARYLHGVDPRHQIPPAGLIPRRRGRLLPYLFSQADIEGLMAATRHLRFRWRHLTMETLIGFLAVTGLRVGEAIRLHRNDIDVEAGVVVVRDSKGHKSRDVPMSPSTCAALSEYATHRDRLFPGADAAFVSTTGTRLRSQNLGTTFAEVVSLAGLEAMPGGRPPRLGGLRHSFAVRALHGFYASGADVTAMVPVLSAFMGHISPASTYWYLSAAPELLAAAARRVEPDETDEP